jgi:hypothetical protein
MTGHGLLGRATQSRSPLSRVGHQNVAPSFDNDTSANSGRECWLRRPVTVDQSSTSANEAVTGNQNPTSGRFTLTVIGGMTLINRGTGFSRVAETTELKPGDRIFVRNGGGVRITYPDGCSVPVRGFATVNPLSPCNSISMPEPPSVVEEPFPNWPLAGPVLPGADPRAAITLTSQHSDNFPRIFCLGPPWQPYPF